MNREIPKTAEWEEKVFSISNEEAFQSIALEVYDFQYHNNLLYRNYCDALGRTPGLVGRVENIPFLPISFFKNHKVVTTRFDPELLFRSSGTTGPSTSTHYVKSASLYQKSFFEGFRKFYGPVEDYCILGLLPSYLEQGHSSLVYMVRHLIEKSGHHLSGFYLYDVEKLYGTLQELEKAGQKTLLIGVTFALLDFAAAFPQALHHTTVMETGGMKGRKKEMTRMELYEVLQRAWGLSAIHSEYGMTELLSQGYSINGHFRTPPWMRIYLRDETDPFSLLPQLGEQTGALNVVDLANIYSCSFIATQDLGRMQEDGSFEVLGRMDSSDVRGCSLMVA